MREYRCAAFALAALGALAASSGRADGDEAPHYQRPATLGNGSTWSIVFSHDAHQKYLLVVDGENNTIWILRRADGVIVSSFGHNGRNAGQFHWVHLGAIDSKGNLYTGEVDTGKRLQKFAIQ